MVDWVDIGSTLTFDFLDYSLSEIQKIILLAKGEESTENTSIDSDTITFFGTAFFKDWGLNFVDYDLTLFPGMPSDYSIGKNFRKSTIVSNSGSPSDLDRWSLYSSGTCFFTYTGNQLISGNSGLMNWTVPYRSDTLVSSSFTLGFDNSPNPTYAPTISPSNLFNIGILGRHTREKS